MRAHSYIYVAMKAAASGWRTRYEPTHCRTKDWIPVDANAAQGLPADSRSYEVGSQILGDLGVSRLWLITNNPAMFGGLESYGLAIVSRVSLPVVETPHNVRYLRTKRERMGHQLDLAAAADTL
jgi:GTP cyclohydrolase II